jgi:ribonuclease HI
LRALLNGLLLAVELDITRLKIELDSLTIAELITSSKAANIFLSAIVCDCRSLLDRFEQFSIKHIFREANSCADLLTKADCVQSVDFILFTTPPTHVLEALDFDSSDASVIRFVGC